MPDTTVKLQDITPVKSTFDNDDQLLLINPTGEARISKEDFLDAMPDDAITLIGDITITGIEGDTVAKQLGALENSKAPAITETTESSAIANFTDGADDMPLHNILAEINPVQDLTYGDPYPAGGSKNKAGDFEVGSFSESSAVGSSYANMKSSSTKRFRTANLIKTDASQFTVSADFTNYRVCMTIFDENQQYLGKTNGFRGWSSSNFTYTGTGIYYVALAVKRTDEGTISATDFENCKLQLEFSASATSYVPYSNICPITGWTGCNVTRAGKNLIPNLKAQDTANRVRLGESTTGNGNFLKAGRYKISVGVAAGIAYSIFWRTYKNGVNGSVNNSANIVLTEDTNVRIWLFADNPGISVNNVEWFQVEVGSTATTYEPYITPSTVSLSWQTEAGTVYGGTIDVATGLLTVDRAMVTLGAFNWSSISSPTQHIFRAPYLSVITTEPPSEVTIWDAISDTFTAMNWNDISGNNNGKFALSPRATNRLVVIDHRYSTIEEFESANADVALVYHIATPQTYQLSGQQLMTLLGTNNVWADTGNVSVTYPADTKLYIEKLTMPTEDDLVANQAITSGKYFMIGNSLYLALANIASGAQITIGTNAQRVSLADALNTINS